MAKFDQRRQTVTYQYNADVINFDNVTNRTEFARQIENLSSEVARAGSLHAIDPTGAKQAQDALKEASQEAQKVQPSKHRITSLIEAAGDAVKGVTALGGLYLGVEKALELAHRLF